MVNHWETNNLAEENPDKTEELFEELQDWQAKTKAPIPTEKNPKYKER